MIAPRRSRVHETLDRVGAEAPAGALSVAVEALPCRGDGWHRLDRLAADPDRVEELARGVAARWRTERLDIGGAALLSELAFVVLLRVATAAVAGGCAPRLRGDLVAVRVGDEGWIDRVAFGATISATPGRDDLLASVLHEFESLHAPLVDHVHARCRRPRRALWRHAGDAVAEAFLYAGEVLGDRRAAWDWGERAVALAPERLRARTGYRVFTGQGIEQAGRVRGQCCLHYRTGGATYCFGCPLKGDDHRDAMLAELAALREVA